MDYQIKVILLYISRDIVRLKCHFSVLAFCFNILHLCFSARINENVDDGDMENDNITFDDFDGSDDEIDDVS